jgi:uroporphyrinogen-III synthase
VPVSAGCPSPADDYLERKLDINEHLIKHEAATFFVRVKGDSMIGAGIRSGDLLVVDRALERLAEYRWAVVTSANGARAAVAAAERLRIDMATVGWAAVGQATARELRLAGVADIWLPGIADGEQVGAGLPVEPGDRVLLMRGSLAGEQLPLILRARGAEVDEVIAYRTLEAPAPSRELLAQSMAGRAPDAVIFASPSAVRGLLTLAGAELHQRVLALPAICIGPTTATAAREAGFTILGRPSAQDAAALAELTAELLGPKRGVPA